MLKCATMDSKWLDQVPEKANTALKEQVKRDKNISGGSLLSGA